MDPWPLVTTMDVKPSIKVLQYHKAPGEDMFLPETFLNNLNLWPPLLAKLFCYVIASSPQAGK